MQNRFRGIAQLVEQRSPKPRAVSSRLTTPATNAQRVLCAFCFYLPRFRAGLHPALTGDLRPVFFDIFPCFLCDLHEKSQFSILMSDFQKFF